MVPRQLSTPATRTWKELCWATALRRSWFVGTLDQSTRLDDRGQVEAPRGRDHQYFWACERTPRAALTSRLAAAPSTGPQDVILRPTSFSRFGGWVCFHLAMGQIPVPRANIPIPTKIGSKMGGEFTYQPKWDPKTVLTTTAIWVWVKIKPPGFSPWFPFARVPFWVHIFDPRPLNPPAQAPRRAFARRGAGGATDGVAGAGPARPGDQVAGERLNADPGRINPCLLIWGCPRFLWGFITF